MSRLRRHTDAVKVLMVVATAGEAERLGRLQSRVVVSGVGPVSAALAAAEALATGPLPDLVLSAGIGGAYLQAGGALVGGAAVASELVYGDLGAWDGEHFLPLDALGLSVWPDAPNPGRFPAWAGSRALAEQLGLPYGPFVTVSSVSGSARQAAELMRRVPGALVEGMEGAGVAQAAARRGVPCAEIRGVSNVVGPRDRAAWELGPALAALEAALRGLVG